MRIDVDACRDPDLLAGEVRRLQAVIASEQTPTAAAAATIPDARHLIWVARNLLWQAHAGFMDITKQQPAPVGPSAVRDELLRLITAIDQMREALAGIDKVPCAHTTMPPCTENAWQHFLDHVQACYLLPRHTGVGV